MIRLYLIVALLCWSIILPAQTIKNVDFYVDGEVIIITYDIANTQSRQKFDVTVSMTKKGGSFNSFLSIPLSAIATSGDVGKNISGGYGKRIQWKVLEQYKSSLEGDIAFHIEAKVQNSKKTTFNMPEMVRVEGGSFMMGSNNVYSEKPAHQVKVPTFYIGKYEVTNAQYAEFLNAKGNQTEGGVPWLQIKENRCHIQYINGQYQTKSGFENYPVMFVTWHGAKAYCKWVGGRLPSEEEWEYAAQGGNRSRGYKYAGSDDIDAVAWYGSNSQNSNNNLNKGRGTHKVGQKQPNELGLYDMSGNVFEWCANQWRYAYNKVGLNETKKVIRGGSFHIIPTGCRIKHRQGFSATSQSYIFGFRVAKD